MSSERIGPPTEDVHRGAEAPGGRATGDVLVVAGVAVAVRLVVVLVWARNPVGLSDPAIYAGFARSIADGDGYRSLLGEVTAYYPPGFPLFLGAVQRGADAVGLGSELGTVTGVVHSLLGGVAAGAAVVAGRCLGRVFGGPGGTHPSPVRTAGLVAGLAMALWPNLVLYSATLLSETLFVALFSLAMAGLLHMGDLRSVRPLVLVGTALSLGLAAVVRPQVLLVVPAAVVAWALARVPARRVLLAAAVLVGGALVCILPWTVRNAVVMDHVVPISTNTGDNLCIGFNDDANGRFALYEGCATGGRYVDSPDVEVERDAELRRRALEWILDNPTELPRLSAQKLWATFGSDDDAVVAWESYGAGPRVPGPWRGILAVGFGVVWWTLVAASVAGIAALCAGRRRREPESLLVLMTTAAGLVVPVLFFGDGRFKMGLAPDVVLLAAAGVTWIVVLVGERAREGGGRTEPVEDSSG